MLVYVLGCLQCWTNQKHQSILPIDDLSLSLFCFLSMYVWCQMSVWLIFFLEIFNNKTNPDLKILFQGVFSLFLSCLFYFDTYAKTYICVLPFLSHTHTLRCLVCCVHHFAHDLIFLSLSVFSFFFLAEHIRTKHVSPSNRLFFPIKKHNCVQLKKWSVSIIKCRENSFDWLRRFDIGF